MEKRKKKEIENRRLYDLIEWRMKGLHKELLLLCISPSDGLDEGTANVVCGIRQNLWHLQNILRDLLIEEEKPKKILKDQGEFPPLVYIH